MNRERWQKVDRIFKSVLGRPAAERAALLDAACEGDVSLRREVESLIEHDTEGSFMEQPALEDATRLLAADQNDSLTGQSVGAYKILEKVGAGGMGVVYRALDAKLNRHVALKLLPTHFTKDEDRLRRFEREARHASALNHPNILTIYDIGSEGGVHFIATEFIEGETLRERLARGHLPPGEALNIAAQVAEALDVAHEAKIVHRDVKPENIMIRRRDGYVKVLDFGLAKLAEGSHAKQDCDPDAATELQVHTEAGVVVGTPSYMSPEQTRGQKVDGRTDVWSLGCVLYEMTMGGRPFGGETAEDMRASILRDEPRPFSPDTPEGLRKIVERALRKNRDERYQTIAEMLEDLRGSGRPHESVAGEQRRSTPLEREGEHAGAATRDATEGVTTARETEAQTTSLTSQLLTGTLKRHKALAATLALFVVLAVAAVVYFGAGWFDADDKTVNSLAVLPFVNVGGNPDTEYFSDGITESIINSLSQLSGLKVMSRNSVFRYKGRETDAEAAARDLNVRAVLTGRVVQRGDALSISVELMDARDNSHLWGAQYNRKLTDIFAVQEEIAKEISEKLRLRLSGEEQKLLTKRYTNNTEAYQLYLKCTYYWNKFTPEAERTAIDYCTQAIAKDPNFALPYAGVVHGYQVSANNGWMRPHDAYPKAKAAMAKGLEVDPNNASLLTAAASTAMFYDWDWAAAERGFKRANEIEPNYWHHHELYAYLLTVLARPDEAIKEAQRAQEIDPLSLIANASAGEVLYRARQYDRSIEQARKALELDPGFAVGHMELARCFVEQGKYEESIAAYKQAVSLMGRTSQLVGELGYTYAVSGKRADALKMLDELKEMSARQYVSPLYFAFVHIGLGDKEQAFVHLEQAYQERSTWLMWIKVDPRFDPLRSEPRFAELLRRMNL
jgi:serine/threonine protein kinase/TolB-like protein/Flp pilus assembly protein TadD